MMADETKPKRKPIDRIALSITELKGDKRISRWYTEYVQKSETYASALKEVTQAKAKFFDELDELGLLVGKSWVLVEEDGDDLIIDCFEEALKKGKAKAAARKVSLLDTEQPEKLGFGGRAKRA
jgi:hypothetical protein